MTKSIVTPQTLIGAIFIFLASLTFAGHPINDFYKKHKNDSDMEARILPPKATSLFVDEDYPEAIELLRAMSSLKYLNYYGDKKKISKYTLAALGATGGYQSLLEDVDGNRQVRVFGEKKGNKVRKVFAVVQTKTQFLLLIGRGKLTQKHIQSFPRLSKEVQ